MAQLKFIVVLWGLWGETKQLLLFVYATQQHMSAGPSMALGGLGSAWSLKVAAVWTNLPVSHVTPSVSLGMWEDSAHPSSCHTVSVLSVLQKAFVSLPLEKGWPPTLNIQSGWLYFFLSFFFFQNSKSQCFFFPCSKRSAVFDYIFAAFNLSFQQTFFLFRPYSLADY